MSGQDIRFGKFNSNKNIISKSQMVAFIYIKKSQNLVLAEFKPFAALC